MSPDSSAAGGATATEASATALRSAAAAEQGRPAVPAPSGGHVGAVGAVGPVGDDGAARARHRARFALRGGLLANELTTMFRRWRNIGLLIALAAIPIALGVAIRLTTHNRGGGFIEQVSNNGLFLVFAALTLTLPVFLPLAVGVVAGDSISGEAAQGTLRYLLVAPVGRNRLLAVKGAALAVFCFAGTATVAVSSLVVGAILFPLGQVTLLSGTSIGPGAALVKAGYITLLVGASLLGLAAIGLFVSTLTDTPVASMAVTVGVTILSGILQSIPQVSSIWPWLFTYQWTSFADVLRDPVYLANITHNLEIQGFYVVVFGLAAWARLSTRDVLA